MPTILRIFFIADKSRLTHNWESLEADVYFANDYANSVDGEADAKSISSNKIMITKEYRRNAHDYFTRINAGQYESNPMFISEAIVYQIDRKRTIHVIVTTVIAFILPFLTFLYALIFQKETQGSIRSLNKRRRRNERILQGLEECRIQLPTTITPKDTNATDDDKRRECPICLSAFTVGDVVIASKHCHCSIRTKAIHGTDIIASVANNSIQSQYHRICFHEKCIFTWLSQRKANPKKLCPCCRQPFLESKQR